MGDCYRGIIHLHSRYSYDSVTPVRAIARLAAEAALDFVILTDHDTTAGSRALREHVRREGLPIEVPIAAEYHTEYGDVIAAFIDEDPAGRDWATVLAETRRQGGLILLPHPFSAHSKASHLAAEVDLIETYNARISAERNEQAARLAAEFGKPGYAGSDAHLARHVGDVLLTVERAGGLRESLLRGRIEATIRPPLGIDDLFGSQVIRAFKQREPKRLAYLMLRGPWRRLRRLGGRSEGE